MRLTKAEKIIRIIVIFTFIIGGIIAMLIANNAKAVEQEETPVQSIYDFDSTYNKKAGYDYPIWSEVNDWDLPQLVYDLAQMCKEETDDYYLAEHLNALADGEVECHNRGIAIPNYDLPFSIYNMEDYIVLSYLTMREASICTYAEKLDVAAVAFTRMITNFGDESTMLGVMNHQGQYEFAIEANYSIDLEYIYNQWDKIPQSCKDAALEVLEGRYTVPQNVVYQSLFKQGSGVYHEYEHANGSVTYICYL